MRRGSSSFGRGSWFCAWREETGFEAVDGKGICFGADLEEEGTGGTAKDEERA